MSNLVQNTQRPHGIDDIYWEAYASKFCGNDEKANAQHYYSDAFPCALGRVSYFEERNVLVLSFRGTDNPVNGTNDCLLIDQKIDTLQKDCISNMVLHGGFTKEYTALKRLESFEKKLNEIAAKLLANSDLKLIITGHSLGGALATLCTADILLNRESIEANRIALITFCSPRTGNKFFANWIDEIGLYKNIRVEVEHDSVSNLPAQNGDAFWHRGKRVIIRLVHDRVERIATEKLGEELNPYEEGVKIVCESLVNESNTFVSRALTSLVLGVSDFGNRMRASIQDGFPCNKIFDIKNLHEQYHCYKEYQIKSDHFDEQMDEDINHKKRLRDNDNEVQPPRKIQKIGSPVGTSS